MTVYYQVIPNVPMSYKIVMPYMKGRWLTYFVFLLLVAAFSLLSLIALQYLGKITHDVIEEGNHSLFISYIGIWSAVVLFRIIIRYAYLYYFEHTSQNVLREVRADLYEKLQGMDFDFYDHTKVGDLMTRMTADADLIRHFVVWIMYMAIEQSVIFIGSLVYIGLMNLTFMLQLLLILPFILTLSIMFSKRIRPMYQEIRYRFSRLNTVVQENISGNRVVKAFAKEDWEIQKFTKENNRFREGHMNASRVSRKYIPLITNMAGILMVYMLVMGGIFVIQGTMQMSDLVVVTSMLWMLTTPLSIVGTILSDYQRFLASAARVKELFDIKPKIQSANGRISKKKFDGTVEFRNVSFKYEDVATLRDVTFRINAGQTVGLIGPTGSGKSTLISLIGRFYDADKGEVLVDGVDVKDYRLSDLRGCMAVAQQDIFLFSDTVEHNIAYGAPNATHFDVVRVAKIADAHDFICQMPEGYNTVIGERGVGLSGGQKQRTALARALLKNPAILILDDTTSSVDMETEQHIYKTLDESYGSCTRFIIAHRISSVVNADIILVMNEGSIIERGTHTQLLEKKGYYYDVFQNQYGDFAPERGEVDG